MFSVHTPTIRFIAASALALAVFDANIACAQDSSVREQTYHVGRWPVRTNTVALTVTRAPGEEIVLELPGIESIALSKVCRSDTGALLACGGRIRAQLINFLSGKDITCAEKDGKVVSCHVGEVDLAEWLLRTGGASTSQARPRYAAAMVQAREDRLGMWADAQTFANFVPAPQNVSSND